MNEDKQKQSTEDHPSKLVTGLSIGLAVSILGNIALGFTAFGGNDVSDNYNGTSATDASFYEERVVELEEANNGLTQQVNELETTLAENEATPEAEAVEEETAETEEPVADTSEEDQNRADAHRVTSNFLDRFLNVNTETMDNEERRGVLGEYVSADLLSQIAPTPDEMVDQGLIAHAEDYDPDAPVDDSVEQVTYEQTVQDKQIFIDEASVGTNTIEVMADVLSEVEDSTDISYELNERYTIQLTQEDGNWVVSNYEIERIDH